MTRIVAALTLLLVGFPGLLFAGARLPLPRYHIVVPARAVQPGETILARLEPEPPPDAFVSWRFVEPEGLHRNWTATEYRAPYVVAPGHPPIELGVSISIGSFDQRGSTTVELASGSVPGCEDCLAPDQSFSELYGDIVSRGDCTLDEMPQPMHRAEPIYPRSSLARDSEATIMVHVLVCRTGMILDAYAPATYSDLTGPPIERDPKLVAAAVDAARRSTFSPGACATWWAIPFRFQK